MRLKLKINCRPQIEHDEVQQNVQELINADREVNNQLEEKKIFIYRCRDGKSQAQKHGLQSEQKY